MSNIRNPSDIPQLLSGSFWAELRIFLAVSKTQSFSEAARILNCSQPTVGRGVKRLEDVLGAQLVIISSRGVVLTERGILLYSVLSRLDFELYELSAMLRNEKNELSGVVRVAIPEGLCGFFVAPKLGAFSNQHPNIRIELQSKKSIEAIKGNSCDVIVGFIGTDAPDLVNRRCGSISFITMASSGYIKTNGLPTMTTIVNHRFIDSNAYSHSNPLWNPWRRLIEHNRIAYTCENSFPYGLMVRSGLGIGLLASYAMAEPSLVPLELGTTIRVPIYLTALTERLKSRPVRLVFEWLSEVLGPTVPWLSDTAQPQMQPANQLSKTLRQLLPSIPVDGS